MSFTNGDFLWFSLLLLLLLYICMEEKRITQKQLKKIQNMNTETNKEEKGN